MNMLVYKESIEKTCERIQNTLLRKGQEYSAESNPFHNFESGGALMGVSKEECLFAYLTKHLVSVADMCKNPDTYSLMQWEEKLGDVLGYTCILMAMRSEE